MKRTGCLPWAAMVLLRAELVTHLPTKTLHWTGTCWLHWANISVFGVSRLAVSRLPQETNTEPAAKFSAPLVHWVQNYSINMIVRITLLCTSFWQRSCNTWKPGFYSTLQLLSRIFCCCVSPVYLFLEVFQLFMLLGKVLVQFLKLFGYLVLTTLIGVF